MNKICSKCRYWDWYVHPDDNNPKKEVYLSKDIKKENCSNWLCNDKRGQCPLLNINQNLK